MSEIIVNLRAQLDAVGRAQPNEPASTGPADFSAFQRVESIAPTPKAFVGAGQRLGSTPDFAPKDPNAFAPPSELS